MPRGHMLYGPACLCVAATAGLAALQPATASEMAAAGHLEVGVPWL